MSKNVTKKALSLFLALVMIMGFMPNFKASAATTTVGALPTGSIIVDVGSSWEHKTGNGYTGSGVTKPIEWLVVAQNHYRSGETTVITDELIGEYAFDNSTDRGHSYGSNHWGNSGTTNATVGIRPWLNSTFYNSFGSQFKSAVIETDLENADYNGSAYTTRDKVWLPSETEMGLGESGTYRIGRDFGYFTSNASRIAKLGSSNHYYWTRSPRSGYSYSVRIVYSGGGSSLTSADTSSNGVRPALHLKSGTIVESLGGNRYQVSDKPLDTTPPTISLSVNTTSWTNGNVTLTITSTDASGVKRVQKPDNTWVNDSTTTYVVSTNGTYTFKAEDNAGNVASKDITVSNIDKIAPTTPTLKANITAPTNQNVVVTITPGTDSGSGISATQYSLNDGAWINGTSVTLTANGTVKARSLDNAGNVSAEGSLSVSNIDKVAPVITIAPYEEEWTNKDIVVNATADKGTLNKETHTFTENGSFEFESTDVYGNKASKIVTITNIDKIAPGKGTITRNIHKLHLTEGRDNESGIKENAYKINDEAWKPFVAEIDLSNFDDGDYEVTLKTIDIAGNESLNTFNFTITYEAEKDSIIDDINNIVIDKDTDIKEAEKELDKIQEEIDKLPEGDKKDEAQDKLDDKRDELENKANEKADEVKDSLDKIIIDDETDLKDIEDELDKIQEEIDKLLASNEKDRLQDKLNNKRNDYKAEESRRIAEIDSDLDNVVITSNLKLEEFINLGNTLKDIQKEVDKLPGSLDKDRLQDKLNNKLQELNKAKENYFNGSTGKAKDDEDIKNVQEDIENSDLDDETKKELIDNLQKKIISLARNYVQLSETLKRDPYMTKANNLIESIRDEGIKASFEARMSKIIADLGVNSESSIKSAESALINAENSKQMAQFKIAKELIERLKPSAEKDAFMVRINALEEEMKKEPVEEEKANDEASIKRAENAVSTAERMKKEVYIKNAENVVNKLIDSPEKDAFLERIESLRG